MDVNPVAVLATRVATTPIPTKVLDTSIDQLLECAAAELQRSPLLPAPRARSSDRLRSVHPANLFGNEGFFDAQALLEASVLWQLIGELEDNRVTDFCRLAFLGVLRQISRANVKKMNTEIDEKKRPKPVLPTYASRLRDMGRMNEVLVKLHAPKVEVREGDALSLDIAPETVGMAVIHPPYLSNTAFSESVQLPLAWLGLEHRQIWKKELRCRGTYVHEPDGLRKYLVGWERILSQVVKATIKGGHVCVIIGDGRIDYVRIPMGAITKEYASDLGLTIVREAQHRINNATGWTLNRRMSAQHLLVFRK
ncbi:MAG: hypothetical protein FJY85_04360 [Deltaproteobacteria bacterium]|nr:hypothetical protein [Deltaproteobacteria bacterium]